LLRSGNRLIGPSRDAASRSSSQRSSPGPHKVLIERADPTYEVMDSKAVNPVVPHRDVGRH